MKAMKILVRIITICLKLVAKLAIIPVLIFSKTVQIIVELIMNAGKLVTGIINFILVVGTLIMFAMGMNPAFLMAVVLIVVMEAVMMLAGNFVSALSGVVNTRLLTTLLTPVVVCRSSDI